MRFRTFWVGLVVVAVLASGYVILCHLLPANDGPTEVERILARGLPGEDSELCEVDQDKVAEAYALARAAKTDWELAQVDIGRLGLLQEVRRALNDWEGEIFSTGSVITHGGTLWSHTGNRAPAAVEDFLVAVAPRLPREPDMGRALGAEHLPETAAVLAKIKAIPPIGPDAVSLPHEISARNRELTLQKRKLHDAWMELDRVLLQLPPELSTLIAERAVKNLKLLDEAR